MFTSPRYALCMPGLARIARRLGESFIGLGIARPVSMAYPVLYQSRWNAGCCVGSVFVTNRLRLLGPPLRCAPEKLYAHQVPATSGSLPRPDSRDPDRVNWKLRACAFPSAHSPRAISGNKLQIAKRILSSHQIFKKPEDFSQISHPRTISLLYTRSPISHKCPLRSCRVLLELHIKRRGRRDRDGRTYRFEPNENVSDCLKKDPCPAHAGGLDDIRCDIEGLGGRGLQ